MNGNINLEYYQKNSRMAFVYSIANNALMNILMTMDASAELVKLLRGYMGSQEIAPVANLTINQSNSYIPFISRILEVGILFQEEAGNLWMAGN